MVIRKAPIKRRLIRSLIMGMVLSVFITQFSAALLLPYSWAGYTELPSDVQHPTYLADIAPPFSSATKFTPELPLIIEDSFGEINTGMDSIEYAYGLSFFDPDFVPWDTTKSETPPSVNLTRYRFGFPWRAMYWDDLSTGSSINIPAVFAYHQKMYQRAGLSRGIGVSFISPGRRLPIVPVWPGLIADILFWSVVWFIPGVIWRTLCAARRKRRGLCLVCGYSIEDLEVCPECGSGVPEQSTQAAC